MSDKQLLLLPTTAKISQAQRKELRDAGFIVLQVDNPMAVRQVVSSEVPPIDGNRLLIDAIKVIRAKDDWQTYRGIVDAIIRELVRNVGSE